MADYQGGLTFVFTDIEGSTQLITDLGGSYGLALRVHRRVLQTKFEEHDGKEMGREGDGLFFIFPSAERALAGAVAAQQKIDHYDWGEGVRLRVRMGVHTGSVRVSGGEYVGLTVHEVARVCGAAHGGQILCSGATAKAAGPLPDDFSLRELGEFILRGIPDARTLYQVCGPDLEDDFAPPREAVRDGGSRVTVWRRSEHVAPHSSLAPENLAITMLEPDVKVEFRKASTGPPFAFRLIVRRQGVIQEEYDGLTVDGATGASAIVNAHSKLIHVDVSPTPGSTGR
jgi:class 3 adenylate cyclase